MANDKTKVREIMKGKVRIGSPEETLSKLVSRMDNYDIKEIPIVEDNELRGIVTYYDVLDTYAPKNVKAKSIMARPSKISADASVRRVIQKMAASGLEALPVMEESKIVGIISEYDILRYLLERGELENYRLKDLTIGVPTLREDDLISKARVIMRKNKVSRLPVVNEKGKCIGMILLMDILRKGYKRLSKRERKPFRSDYKKFLEGPVGNIMRDVVKVREDDKLEDVVRSLLEEGLKGISVLNQKDEPIGIFSRIRLFHRIAEKYGGKRLRVTISGMDLSWEITNGIKSLVKSAGRKLKYFTKIKHLKIHLKSVHETSEGSRKIETILEAQTSGFSIRVEETGFDILHTIKRALDTLEKRLRKKFYER